MPKARILVIEDDDDARMMYGIMLRSWGYTILEATTGGEGIRVARKQKPDLILLDVMMPDMDGYEVCRQLRADPQFRLVPILFLSALDAMDDRIKGYTMGGDDFITKGQVDYKELGVRIKAALDRTQRIKRTPQPQQEGGALGLLSLRGGVGVSTIALNLAHQAATQSEQPILLIDLALPVGSLGLWSGIEGTRHIVELLSRNPSEITLTQLQNFSVQTVHGFDFIAGPPTAIDLSSVRMEATERMLNILRSEGYFVIIDLGRATLPLLWRLPAYCDWVAVVTSADPTARTLASVALNSLSTLGVDPRALLLIYNDLTRAKPADIGVGLPRTPDIFIPYTRNFQNMPEPSPLARLWSMITKPVQDVATP
jgi:DNA-binding response OmpR family regulator